MLKKNAVGLETKMHLDWEKKKCIWIQGVLKKKRFRLELYLVILPPELENFGGHKFFLVVHIPKTRLGRRQCDSSSCSTEAVEGAFKGC